MIRFSLLLSSAAALLLTAPLASADHGQNRPAYSSHSASGPMQTCDRIRQDRQLAGGLIGAVAGGLIGVALAEDSKPSHYHPRSYRHRHGSYRHYGRYGHGYRSHRESDEIAGAVIGGALGAAIGAGIAGQGQNCPQLTSRQYDPALAPTRSPTGPAWQTRPYPRQAEPVAVSQAELYGGPEHDQAESRRDYQAEAREACTQVQRETRLPDGSFIREPVRVCQDPAGYWILQDD